MPRLFPVLTGMLLVIGGGVVQGFWTNRWDTSPAPAEAAERLKNVPLRVGDWVATALPVKTGPEPIAGQLYRRYVHQVNGTVITVALYTGQPGPVSIHTPDVCYKASGFDVAVPLKYKWAGVRGIAAGEFWTADLQKIKATEKLHQRIFCSWTTDGTWRAAGNPRWEFADQPVLYKLYLVRELTSAEEPLEEDPCIDLMSDLLPQLQKCVFSGV